MKVQVLFAALAAMLTAQLTAAGPEPRLSKPGVCLRESAGLVGRKGVLVGGKIRQPRKIRDAHPKYPTFPPGTVGSGNWIGEALIGTDGKIVRVWVLREVTITPPFPAFNQVVVDAIRQWEFEPLRIDGVVAPICMTVSVSINWS